MLKYCRIRGCKNVKYFIQKPWMHSGPGLFQFVTLFSDNLKSIILILQLLMEETSRFSLDVNHEVFASPKAQFKILECKQLVGRHYRKMVLHTKSGKTYVGWIKKDYFTDVVNLLLHIILINDSVLWSVVLLVLWQN